jgi:hypothetical protein
VDFFFLLGLGALLSGCAQTQQFTPAAALARYQQHGLSANIVELQVNNLWPEQSAGDVLYGFQERGTINSENLGCHR